MDKITDKDLYEILRIEKNATLEEIKIAYRRLARIYHPDINESAESLAIFKDIRMAYEILSSPEKKKLYDLKNGFNQPKDTDSTEESAKEEEKKETLAEETDETKNEKSLSQLLTDIIEGIFAYPKKNGNKKVQNDKGEDIFANVTISTKEALLGTTRIINIMQTYPCPNCNGKRFINEAVCPRCKGTGEISNHKRISTQIPPNTKDGEKIKLAGMGNKPKGDGDYGDLYLIINIDEKSLFTVKENIVYMDLPILPYEAALGADIEIPTFYENIIIKIPPNTSSGQKFRLKGQGLQIKELGVNGDMIVTVIIKNPPKFKEEEIELYKKLKGLNTYNIREGLKDNE